LQLRLKLIYIIIIIYINTTHIFSKEIAPKVEIEHDIPISIEEAILLGEKQNLGLISKKLDLDIARAREIQSGLWRNPSISLLQSLMPFHNNYNQTTTGGPKQLDVVINYPLDITGKIRAGKNLAESQRKLQELMLYGALYELNYSIYSSYTDLLLQEELTKLYKNREDNLSRLVRMIQNRVGGGGLQPLLLTRAELAVTNAKLDSLTIALNAETSRKQLALLLGYEKYPNLKPISKLRDIVLSDAPTYEEVEPIMKEKYPPFLTAKMIIEVTTRNLLLNYAKIWNDFNLSMGVSNQSAVNANPNSILSSPLPGEKSWAIGINIPLPIFDRNQGEISAIKSAKEQAEYNLKNYEITIEKDLKTTLEKIHLYYRIISEIEKSQLSKAESVIVIQQRMFGTGGSNLLEFFDALNAYTTTLSTYYQTIAEYRKNRARLIFLLGSDKSK